MAERQKFALKIEKIRARFDMYVCEPTYKSISAFVAGMDCYTDYRALRGFQQWLCREFDVESPYHWIELIETMLNDSSYANDEDYKIDVLLELVMEFLMDTMED
jgi:hypothetical protein